jgi:hypothetical protein
MVGMVKRKMPQRGHSSTHIRLPFVARNLATARNPAACSERNFACNGAPRDEE